MWWGKVRGFVGGKESRARADGAREAKVFAVAIGMDIRVVSDGEGEGLEVLRA